MSNLYLIRQDWEMVISKLSVAERQMLATDSNTDEDMLSDFASKGTYEEKLLVAKNPKLQTYDLFELCYRKPDKAIRANAIQNPNITSWILGYICLYPLDRKEQENAEARLRSSYPEDWMKFKEWKEKYHYD